MRLWGGNRALTTKGTKVHEGQPGDFFFVCLRALSLDRLQFPFHDSRGPFICED